MVVKNLFKHVFCNEDERCEVCSSDDVITLSDSDGGSYDHCNECQHDSSN